MVRENEITIKVQLDIAIRLVSYFYSAFVDQQTSFVDH